MAGSGQGMETGGGGDVWEVLRAAGEGTAQAVRARGRLVAASEPELDEGVEVVGRLRVDLDVMLLGVVQECRARSMHNAAGLSLHDWVGLRCPWMSRAEVSDLVIVADAAESVVHAPVLAAVWDGRLPIRRAARLVRALNQVAPVSSADAYGDAVAVLLPVAIDPRYTDRELRRVTDHLVAVAVPQLAQEARSRSLRAARGLHESSLADGSLTRFVLTADPEGAAVIRAVVTSPLAAPTPDAEGPDVRTPAQRRYDALLTVLGRGVSAPGEVGSTDKAKVIVTIPYASLVGALGMGGPDCAAGAVASEGPVRAGAGHALTGEVLSPATVRRLACAAQIIPMVLGSASEVLDLGRGVRLASPAQRLVLWRRDRHCTFPGCTVPPQWCDAHHLDPWAGGGRTDLSRLALVCPRHHTRVHERALTGTLTGAGMTWDVRPRAA